MIAKAVGGDRAGFPTCRVSSWPVKPAPTGAMIGVAMMSKLPFDRIEYVLDAFRRRCMLAQHNRAYDALKADPRRWQEELDEREGWARASADNLKGIDRGTREFVDRADMIRSAKARLGVV